MKMTAMSNVESDSVNSGKQVEIAEGIGHAFVEKFYTTLSDSPENVYQFYGQDSWSFFNETLYQGQKKISEMMDRLDYKNCKVRIYSVVGNNVSENTFVYQVCGEITLYGAIPRRFFQTFVLVSQAAKRLYLQSEIFQWVERVFTRNEAPSEDNLSMVNGEMNEISSICDGELVKQEISSQAVKPIDDTLTHIASELEKAQIKSPPTQQPIENVEDNSLQNEQQSPVIESAETKAKKTWASIATNQPASIQQPQANTKLSPQMNNEPKQTQNNDSKKPALPYNQEKRQQSEYRPNNYNFNKGQNQRTHQKPFDRPYKNNFNNRFESRDKDHNGYGYSSGNRQGSRGNFNFVNRYEGRDKEQNGYPSGNRQGSRGNFHFVNRAGFRQGGNGHGGFHRNTFNRQYQFRGPNNARNTHNNEEATDKPEKPSE